MLRNYPTSGGGASVCKVFEIDSMQATEVHKDVSGNDGSCWIVPVAVRFRGKSISIGSSIRYPCLGIPCNG